MALMSCIITTKIKTLNRIKQGLYLLQSYQQLDTHETQLHPLRLIDFFPQINIYFNSSKAQMKSSSLIKLLLLHLLLALCTRSAGTPTILYATTNISARVSPMGSLAGGTLVYIFGTNFSPDPSLVSVAYGSYPCNLVAGSSSSSMLACTTTAATSSSSLNNLPLNINIQGQTPLKCTSSSCVFTYSNSNTPVVQELIPRSVVNGDLLYSFGIHRITDPGDSRSPGVGDIKSLLINGYTCSIIDVVQEDAISPATRDYIACSVVSGDEAGEYNFTETVTPGTANSSVRSFQTSYLTGNIYQVRLVPKITQDFPHKGGYNGQKLALSFTGKSPNTSSYTCQVAGQSCKVSSVDSTNNMVYVEVPKYNATANPTFGILPKESNDSSTQMKPFLGSNGFRYSRYSLELSKTLSQWVDYFRAGSIGITVIQTQTIYTELGSAQIYGSNPYVEYLNGYLFIPAAGNFSFYGVVDDKLIVNLATAQNNSNPANMRTIIQIDTYVNDHYNPYINGQDNKKTIQFTAAGYYYMQIVSVNTGDKGYFKVMMQAPNTTANAPANPTWQIDYISIKPANIVPEIIKVTVQNAGIGSNSFTLNYYTTAGGLALQSSNGIKANASAVDFLNALRSLYTLSNYDPVVTLTMLTSSKVATLIASNAAYYQYTITIQRYRDTSQATTILPIVDAAYSASVVITNPQKHSPAISGTYKLFVGSNAVGLNNGTSYSVYNIPYTQSNLNSAINNVYRSSEIQVKQIMNTYFEDSIQFVIEYFGVPSISQITFDASGLKGGANNLFNTNYTVLRNYRINSLYDPIPFEFLRTAESTPQLYMTVNKIPISCANCAYTFDSSLSLGVTSGQLNGYSLQFAMSNPNALAFTLDDIQVTYLGAPCFAKTGTITNFACYFQNDTNGNSLMPSGTGIPVVHVRSVGYADISALTPITVAIVLTGSSPTVSGPQGGVAAYVTGSGFPTNNDNSQILISLCGNKVINYTSFSNNRIDFIVPALGSTCANNSSSININSATFPLTFTYDSTISPLVSSLSLTSGSPIVKQTLQITGSNFQSTSNIQAFLYDSNGVQQYELTVINSTSTTINCILGGGKTGNYYVRIINKGSAGTAISPQSPASRFQYKIFVDSVTPASGSMGGGYNITIVGQNFASNDSTNVFVGVALNSLCTIVSISSTHIICTVPFMDTSYTAGVPVEVVVTARAVEESECRGSCGFTYDASVSNNVTVLSSTVFSANDIITITGSDLTGGKVYVGGILVPSTNSTAQSITFAYPALTQGDYLIQVMTANGYAYPPLPSTTELWLSNGISRSSGSYAGHMLTVAGNGMTTTINDGNVFTIKCPIGGIFTLKRISATANKHAFQVPMNLGTTDQYCWVNITQSSNTVFRVYGYSYSGYMTNISFAKLTSAGSNNFYLTKTNSSSTVFQTAWAEVLDINGNPTSSVYPFTVSSANASTYLLTSNNSYLPAGSLRIRAHSFICGYSTLTGENITISMASAPSGTTATVSYLGGAKIALTGSGFVDIVPANNKVTVCGMKATVVSATSSGLVVSVPPLITAQTQNLYGLGQPEAIAGAPFGDTPATINLAVDNNTNTYYTSTSNGTCYVGVDFGVDTAANIESISYMGNPSWAITSSMIAGAVFEGSNDQTSWTNIFTVDTSAHMGWNYWPTPTPSSVIYRYIRFRHNSTSMCQLAEISFFGQIYSTIPVNATGVTQCNVKLILPTQTLVSSTSIVQYSAASTSTITSIAPIFGPSIGGTIINIQGSNFGSQITITIDGVNCAISNQTSASIYCTTGLRASPPSKGNSFLMVSDGNPVILASSPFLYIDRWSAQSTWGGEALPRAGDSVLVPKGMTLLVDVSPPKLFTVIVDGGAIIFSDEQDMTFDASYFLLNGGQFRAGTPSAPYQHKLTFTLYGDYYGKQLPTFGNKMIGCKNCKFNMHGIPRYPTWTDLDATISPGQSTLHLTQAVDWNVGESIAVAASSFNHYESEQRIIASKSGDNKTLTVTVPFNFRHFSGIETYGGKDFYMRAEVALLTRNIVMQGDESSNITRYGSHLMFNGKVKSGLDATLSYAEFRNCGQPKITGRYCTHFHMAGEVPKSFVRGISVHNSYARVLTIHGTHYLLVEKNVGYRVQGHNIFIEDGIETKNIIQDNLMISSINSFVMLQSDITVASYWITNPFNTVVRNRAAGGDFYGFWYQIKDHPDGPSATSDVCPMGMQLGLSRDNIAHSNIRFGLRIFKLSARQFPCLPTKDENLLDPYSANPAILSTFSNYTLWKNKECGFLGEQLGYTTIEDFKTIDSVKGGMQFHKTNFTKQLVVATDSVIVGYSQGNAPADLDIEYNRARGLIAARTDGLLVQNVQFINFGPTMTPLKSCSECYDFRLWVTGGKTTYFKNITYTNIQGSYIFWEKWRREIFMDLDGSLTAPIVANISSLSPQAGGSITPYRASLLVPNHCFNLSGALWDNSIYCDDTQTLRGILFTNAIPTLQFSSIDIRVKLLTNPYENFTTENLTDINYSKESMIVIKKMSMDIPHSWAMPFATNNYYNVHWKWGIDFTHMAIAPSRLWSVNDGVVLRFNYSDHRQLYQIGKWYQRQLAFPYISGSDTLITPDNCVNGDYFHDINSSYLFVCVSGRNKTIREWIDVNGLRCLNACPEDLVGTDRQNFTRYWSDATNWPNNTLPAAGQNVTIPDAWNLVLDCATPIFNYVEVRGYLIFDQSQDLLFQAYYIWVKGKIKIGTQANPYKYNATIVLHGEKDTPYLVVDQDASGNKMMVVTGGLEFYGSVTDNTWNRLIAMAPAKSTSITVQDASGWAVGNKLVIGASYSGTDQSQNVTITAINGNTITFTPALAHQHYGDSQVTIKNSVNTLDARSGVGLLSRNIRITKGPDANGWGCRVFVYSYMEMPAVLSPTSLPSIKTGYAILDGVQFDNCAQYDTSYAGLRIQKLGNLTNTTQLSSVTRSSFHNCVGICVYIDASQNITFDSNVFFWARKFLVLVYEVDHYIFTNNLLTQAHIRSELDLTGTLVVDDVACYQQFTQIDHANAKVSVKNNLAQGCMGQGFVFPFSPCTYLDNYRFVNNTAGSCVVAFMIDRLAGQTCIGATGFIGYASEIGLMANPPGSQTELIYKNMFFTDCGRGITLRYAHQTDENTIYLQDSYFAGYSRPACQSCYSSTAIHYCQGGYAVRMVSTTLSGQTFPLVKKNTIFDVICTQQAFDSKSFFNNVIFQNYQYDNADVPFCRNMSVFKRHNLASDHTGSAYLTNSKCNNCDKEAWAYFDAPSPSWFGWFGGCGQLDCTGPNNYFIHDQDGKFTGSGVPSQILANNSMIGDHESACTFIPEMNGHHCLFEELAVIQYESIAPDYNKRIMWPVNLTYDGGNWTSRTNGWREWSWNGPEPMNQRLARFWSVVKLHQHYNLTYSSSPPTDTRFQLQKRLMPSGNPKDWVIIRIYYPLPNSLQVLVTDDSGTNRIVKPFPSVEGTWENLSNHTSVCGANNFYFTNGTIEFVLNGVNNCQVRVKLSNYIQVTARLTVSVANFYNNNGPTTFLTNICAFLGIDPGRLKIVSVRSGSTEVTFFVIPEVATNSTNSTNTSSSPTSTDPVTASAILASMSNEIANGLANTTLNLGYPVIDYQVSVVVFNPDGTVYVPSNSSSNNNTTTIIILATVIPLGILLIAVVVWVCLRRMRSKVHTHDILGMQSSQMDITEKKDHVSNLDHVSNEKYEMEIVEVE